MHYEEEEDWNEEDEEDDGVSWLDDDWQCQRTRKKSQFGIGSEN